MLRLQRIEPPSRRQRVQGAPCPTLPARPPPADPRRPQVFVGRSASAHGPFLDKNGRDLRSTGGTLVLASHGNVYAPGGQSVFTDSKSGKDVFVYHYVPVSSPTPYSDAYASLGLNAIDWSSVSGAARACRRRAARALFLVAVDCAADGSRFFSAPSRAGLC